MNKNKEQSSVFPNSSKHRFGWMDVYFIVVAVAYIAWRGVVFLKRIL